MQQTQQRARLLTIFIAIALVSASCSGGSTSQPEPAVSPGETPADPDDSPDAVTAPTTGPDSAVVSDDDDELLPCSIGALPPSSILLAYAAGDPAGPLGPNGDRFRALIDDYLDRCGGDITVGTFDLSNSDACDQISELGPLLTIADVASEADAACIAEGTANALWHEAGLATASIEAGGGQVVSTDLPPDVSAAQQVALLSEEGVVDGRSIAVVHGDDIRATAIATDGLARTLPGAALTAMAPDGCSAGAPEADIVFAVVSVACLADLVTATAGSPLWVVLGSDAALADESAATLEDVNLQLDGALAYSALPVNGGGWPFSLDPHPRDRACNRRLDDLIGTNTTYPGESWSAGVRLCSTVFGVIQALAAAGDAPTGSSVFEAAVSVSNVPLPRGLLGGMTVREPWLAGPEMFALEWSADCTCWNFATGPLTP